MKLFWEFVDFQVWKCCKNNQILKKKQSSLTFGGALTDVI